ncbi:uncharacterized protein LOC129591650 [Paramacrobiotus metropolitanus]|uniref:uncharacterized protein LOC129591650 n=1 Tax=Paramacrobiotus metropolitanus TaxID=2943436 RepID=UPI002445D63D|nr:uncharacterized protein LOC129591650 [Paramacrobiotus metropolitanus]
MDKKDKIKPKSANQTPDPQITDPAIPDGIQVTLDLQHPLFATVEYENGDRYVGEYSASDLDNRLMRNGVGKYVTFDGHLYSGHWKNNKLSGPICLHVWPLMNVHYKGEMLDGQYHGEGEYSDGKIHYFGRFCNGTMCGPGVLTDCLGGRWTAVQNRNNTLRFWLRS